MKVLSTEQTRKAENKAFEKYYSEKELMFFAGDNCAKIIIATLVGFEISNPKIMVYCGNGKNAGDGFVIAKTLKENHYDVSIVLCDKEPTIDEPRIYYNDAIKAGVKILHYNDSINCDVIIDCLFGIGFKGQPRKPFDSIFESINNSNSFVISIDTPSGTNSQNGEICENCISADMTLAISTYKNAHILPPSNSKCGYIKVVDIGIPEDCYKDQYVETIDYSFVKNVFKSRDYNSNKGTFGHQLNICGSYTMPGAAVIAAKASILSGSGLVKCAIPNSSYPLISAHLTQPIFMPLDDNEGKLSTYAYSILEKEFKWANSILIGCGIGISEGTREVVYNIIKNSNLPLVVDADALTIISTFDKNLFKNKKMILTPHPGEAARLLNTTVEHIQSDRITSTLEIAQQYNAIVVLKGANTIVTDGKNIKVNITGNPGMAMAGTGDMLSGMITSYISQGYDLFYSACCGVYLHGLSGDCARDEYNERSMTVDNMLNSLAKIEY